MNRAMIWILILTLGFSGCTMIPKYTRPDAPVPEQFPNGDAYAPLQSSAEGPSDIPQIKWQEFFTDPKLQKVIEMTLKNNRDLRLAVLNVERARGLYGIQRAGLLPVVNADGRGGEQQVSADFVGSGVKRTSKTYEVNLGVAAWEIDFFGRIRSLEKQALQDYLSTEQARRSAQISLVSSVVSAYLMLAAERENLALSESTLESQTAACKLVQRQYELGIVTQLDFHRAKIPVEMARRDMAHYKELVAQGRNALDLLAGAPVPEDLLPVNLADIHPTREIIAGMSSEVLLNRPDIIAAEHHLKSAYANIGAARAAFFPRISLTTTLGSASADLSGLFKAGTATWLYAPQLVMPVFDARTWSAYKVSQADQKIALTQYEKTVQTAFREVADALATNGTIGERVEAQQSLVDTAGETYRLANSRYSMGIDSYLSVLDAQRELFAAQQVLVYLRQTKAANQVHLYAIFGGGAGDEGSGSISLKKKIFRFFSF